MCYGLLHGFYVIPVHTHFEPVELFPLDCLTVPYPLSLDPRCLLYTWKPVHVTSQLKRIFRVYHEDSNSFTPLSYFFVRPLIFACSVSLLRLTTRGHTYTTIFPFLLCLMFHCWEYYLGQKGSHILHAVGSSVQYFLYPLFCHFKIVFRQ